MISKTFCVAPFVAAEVRKDGRLAPCCRYLDKDIKPDWNFRNFTQWWAEYLQPMREDLLNGVEHAGCNNCWRDEQLGVMSYRRHLSDKHKQYRYLTAPLPMPVDQMYNFGIFCNLSCIMCSPSASSSFATEYELNKSYFNSINISFGPNKEIKWFKGNDFVSMRDRLTAHAQIMRFQGGEPLLSPDLLAMLADVPHPELIELFITTNITTLTDHMLVLFRRFKKINISISLEGIGQHNDYLRYGSEWSELASNIDRLLQEPFHVIVVHNFQRTSLRALPALFDYTRNKGMELHCNKLDWPPYLSIDAATDQEKQECLDQLGDSDRAVVEKFLQDTTYNAALDEQFWRYVEMLDQIRGTNFRQTFGY